MKKTIILILLLSSLLMSCSFAYILTSTPVPPSSIPPTKTPIVPTETLMIMCTQPACAENESYYCEDDCPGGCGTTCATHTPGGPTVTPMIMCTPPACAQNEVYYCEGDCPGGCGTTCATQTPETSVNWWKPEPGLTFHIQYTGNLELNHPVDVYNIDLFDTPKETIDQLHQRGVKVICYFSAGTYEDWRPDANQFPQEVLGTPLVDWPGERWLDIRRVDLLTPIMAARLDMAAAKGCDAVDPDNVDGYANDPGFGLTSTDQIAYNRWIANEAHARGLAVGLKNGLRLIPQLVSYFEFAVNEECFSYQECGSLAKFTDENKAVFVIEYGNDAGEYCAIANTSQFMMVRKNLELDAWNFPCWDN